jgi:hypothetical protein
VRRHAQLGVATDAADNEGEFVHPLPPQLIVHQFAS